MSDTQDERETIKLAVFNPNELNVAISFEHGWHGTCTNCGHTLTASNETEAFITGQTHVNTCNT